MHFHTASDFVAGYVGQSEGETRAILNKAMGSLLIIDEAYCLMSGKAGGGSAGSGASYGEQVINTIVENVQVGQDRAVVLLGYKKVLQMCVLLF